MPSISPQCHQKNEDTNDTWITPKWLIERIGPFDLDPCEAVPQPWKCADRSYTFEDNGLLRPWSGFVFCNPPYGEETGIWLDRLALHGNGIALVFARTETRMFFKSVWPKASSLLFLKGRLTFFYPDGTPPRTGANSGGPSVLIGYGKNADQRLAEVSDLGALVRLK